LEPDEAPEERLLLGAPPAAVEVQDGRVAGHEGRQAAAIARVIEELDVGERAAGCGAAVSHGGQGKGHAA
jgi:hypothetical protein